MRASELGILGQLQAAHHHQGVEQLVDGRLAQLGERRVRGAPRGHEPHAQHAARGQAEAVVGRLAVDQEPHAGRRQLVGHLGAVAAALLAHHVEQADAPLARQPQPLGGRHLRRQNALGVAHAAPEQHRRSRDGVGKNGGTQS